jgi:hypothetical protein
MMADLAKKIDGKKYMWDGKEYSDRGSAEEAENNYLDKNFEVKVIEEGDIFLVYTRKIAEAVVVEGEAPI